MIVFPGAKINIGLYVTGIRADGYHNIETLFYPIGLSDILEVLPDPGISPGDVGVTLTGIPVEGTNDNNLVVKAYRMVGEHYPLPGVQVYLHKCIPTGAGLGGGSSDGASMLLALNALFHLQIPKEKLFEMSLRLGSDCPFFLNPVPAIAKGRGEICTPSGLSLSHLYLALFHPKVGISTADAYRHMVVSQAFKEVDKIEQLPFVHWKESVYNAFEPYAFGQHRVIESIKNELYSHGAVFASMTGSGSAVYGLFDQKPEIPAGLKEYLIWEERLK